MIAENIGGWWGASGAGGRLVLIAMVGGGV